MRQGVSSRQWSIEEALALVCDAAQPLSRTIIALLSGLGRSEVRRFADCWRSMPAERRRELVATMVEMAEADFELDFNAIFRWALQSEDAQIRERAVEGLWEDDRPSLIEPLARMVSEDPSTAVRAQAAMALGRFALLAELGDIIGERAARVRDSLLRAIEREGEDREVRRRAIESVAYLSDAPVREIIDEAYASGDEQMRLSAVFAMGRTADRHWAGVILRELHSPTPAMRYEAARAAGEISLRPTVPDLIGLLADSDAEVRQMAAWALGQVGGPQARRALEACRAAPDEAMREAAEEAISELDFASEPLDMLIVEPSGDDEMEPGEEGVPHGG